MRASPRLRRLERSLSPTQAVLIFLVAAQRHPSAEAYARTCLVRPDAPIPLGTIIDRVEATTRHRHRGQLESQVREAVRRSTQYAAFLYRLAMRLDAGALALAAEGPIRIALVRQHLGDALEELLSHRHQRGMDDPIVVRWRTWRDIAVALVGEVRAEDGARLVLEHRHLGGRSTLFDETADAWDRLLADIDGLDGLTRIPRGRRRKPRRRHRARDARGHRRLQARVDAAVERLTAATWVEALTDLGRHDEAASIVRARL